jgi:hypothetical protein
LEIFWYQKINNKIAIAGSANNTSKGINFKEAK